MALPLVFLVNCILSSVDVISSIPFHTVDTFWKSKTFFFLLQENREILRVLRQNSCLRPCLCGPLIILCVLELEEKLRRQKPFWSGNHLL